MSTVIDRIEAGIVELLKGGLASAFYIAPFPEDPKKFDAAKMSAASLVHYSGSKYTLDQNGQPVSQSREMSFAIQLYLHSLRGHKGGYAAIEATRKALQNVSIEGATPFRMVSDDLADQQGGQWIWQVNISCAIPAVAAQVTQHIPRLPMQFEKTGT